jgi:hypothetical protein
MGYLKEELKKRNLPNVLTLNNGKPLSSGREWPIRRKEIIDLLSSQIYGFSPPAPSKVSSALLNLEEKAFANKALHSLVEISFDTPKGNFSFPVNLIVPKVDTKVPLFLHIAFRPEIPDRYLPAEEIIDEGFAIASFCYTDITDDKDDGFSSGLAGMYKENTRKPDEWGKISMWAWAAQRVMDYIETLDEIDKDRIAVVGHSRLGKTALWTAAQDERFFMGISNNSGCSGAALSRRNKGETVKDIVDRFGYWFCDNYDQYADNEKNMPFDQHFLLAAIAPRRVYVSSAKEDQWADPEGEFLSCVAANDVYKLLGLEGILTEDEFPIPEIKLHKGYIGYHLRYGSHDLSRYDWRGFMEYITQSCK